MPSIHNVKPKLAMKLAEKLNFYLHNITGSHHIYKHNISRKIVVIPFHNKELKIKTVQSIIKDLGVDKQWFLDNL